MCWYVAHIRDGLLYPLLRFEGVTLATPNRDVLVRNLSFEVSNPVLFLGGWVHVRCMLRQECGCHWGSPDKKGLAWR